MPLGAHGHERVGVEVLRVLCPKCGNRVSLEPGENETKCTKCGMLVHRPKTEKPKEKEE
jgi:ribosomal protein S27AE